MTNQGILNAVKMCAAIGAAGMFPSHSAARLDMAPQPSVVRAKAPVRDIEINAALSIREPAQFRVWEPVLEEISGRKALPADRVFIVPKQQRIRECGEDFGGCHRYGGLFRRGFPYISPSFTSIYLDDELFVEGKIGPNALFHEACDRKMVDVLERRSRFEIWIHEQAHHFHRARGYHLTDQAKWITQTEAVAFEYYAADHIARAYNNKLGLNLLSQHLGGMAIAPEFVDKAVLKQVRTALSNGDFEPWNDRLAHASALILLGSGLDSFGDTWYFINNTPTEAVIERIRKNADAATFNRGREIAEARMKELSGGMADDGPEREFDIASLRRLDFGEAKGMSRIMDMDRNTIGFTMWFRHYSLHVINNEGGDFHDVSLEDNERTPYIQFTEMEGGTRLALFDRSGQTVYLRINVDSGEAWQGYGIEIPGTTYCARNEVPVHVDTEEHARFAASVFNAMFRRFEKRTDWQAEGESNPHKLDPQIFHEARQRIQNRLNPR